MATYVRSNEVNDIFQLNNGDYVKFPRSMDMSEDDVEAFYSE